MAKKPFPFSVCEQCCNGDVSPEQIKEAVEEYLEKNPLTETDPTVSDWAKGETKPTYTADEVGAYTKEEVDNLIGNSGGGSTETILYEDVVNTPEWDNQPTYDGTLDSAINTEDFFYVTLKDTDGTALPAGKFKLMSFYDKYDEAYETIFTLAGLDTGNAGVLSENVPVEFTSDYKLRNSGVSMVTVTLYKNLNTDIKTIRTTANGRFIKSRNGDYFAIYYLTDKNVSNYHSASTTTWNSDSGKYIWQYANFGADAYKEGKFADELILTKLSATEFNAYRNTLLRCLPWGKTEYIHYPKNNVGSSIGFGSVLEDNTTLRQVSVAAVNGRGYFRNGTVIRVTEVK